VRAGVGQNESGRGCWSTLDRAHRVSMIDDNTPSNNSDGSTSEQYDDYDLIDDTHRTTQSIDIPARADGNGVASE